MRIDRFFAPDMRRAIARVRSEHGPDAVIVSSRSVDGGVEIVAAVDYDQELMAQMVAQEAELAAPEAPPAAAVMAAPAAAAAADAAAAASAPALAALQRELEAMRLQLDQRLAQFVAADRAPAPAAVEPGSAPASGTSPEQALLRRQAGALGLDAELADALVTEALAGATAGAAAVAAAGTPWQRLVRALARRIDVVEQDPADAGGVIALVGPTGVGKTTTIAKLAARHCLKHGPQSLVLVSTDDFRVGAERQLEAFGAILGVTVRRAADGEALARVLAGRREGQLMLIDTAGLAPRDQRLKAGLERLRDVPEIRTYLVLPANVQASVLRRTVRRFAAAGLAGAVLTKIDEADGLGAALSVLIAERLPVAWLSDGQRVPEDLKLARTLHLISWASVPPALPDPSRLQARLQARAPSRTGSLMGIPTAAVRTEKSAKEACHAAV